MDGSANGAIYKHRQMGWPIVGGIGGALVVLGCAAVILFLRQGPPSGEGIKGVFAWLVIFLFLLAVLISFASLTVVAEEDFIELRFGPGVIRKKFQFDDIQACKAVRNPRLLGWGIRWFPGCWVFNVSGFEAVELLMKNGKRYRVGTDEPEKLRDVIQRKLSREPH